MQSHKLLFFSLLALTAQSDEEALSHYRRVRDEIRAFVESLPEGIAPAQQTGV